MTDRFALDPRARAAIRHVDQIRRPYHHVLPRSTSTSWPAVSY
ncbi:hypothetical protein [Paractinoplanes ferrugineus]|nr:hypothetical protein [Actinoplanes ferrugineus]